MRASIFLPFLCGVLLGTVVAAAELEEVGKLCFEGSIFEPEDISGVAELGDDQLVIAADEGARVQVLEKKGDCPDPETKGDRYEVIETIQLADETEEADFEALATVDRTVYALGSHSWKRKKVKDDKSNKKNRERLATLATEPGRDVLFRFDVEENGKPDGEADFLRARNLMVNDVYLHSFTAIPSKENGVDFEGIAARGDKLYLGLRGPVLRGNFASVLALEIEDPFFKSEDYEILFVDLGGRGIRGMTEVTGGFLLLAGAVGDADATYQLYFWDGTDCVPDDGVVPCNLDLLGEVPAPGEAKAEGVALTEETAEAWTVLVVYDSAPDGDPTLFLAPRP